jgi:dihydrodipicolinate synthase/N-acetylneuraminate lyase
MRTLEETRPRHGLSVPVVTVLGDAGELLEADQRALVRHVVQDGRGADILFAAGTTGEWDKLRPEVQRRSIQVCTEEAAKLNAALTSGGGRGVEVWAGVTAHSARGTLENLESACASGADAAVLAPLSIRDVRDIVRFVTRDVSDLLDGQRRRIPVYLYDNADIAVDPRVSHLRTRQVKALSRLDFVRGIKVTASRGVMGNYTKAAASFRERGEFGIYAGNAMVIFDLFRPRTGWWGSAVEHWNRWLLRDTPPIGVVAGPANVFPREWAFAWQVCRAGDVERMEQVAEVLEAFRAGTWAAGGRRTIACIKRALRSLGVISSDAVARGTPELAAPDAERFDRVFEEVLALARERIAPAWRTVVEGGGTGSRG